MEQLPKAFYDSSTNIGPTVQLEESVLIPQVEESLLLTKKNLGFLSEGNSKDKGRPLENESNTPTTAPGTDDEMSSVPDSVNTSIDKDDVPITAEEERKYIIDAASAIEKQLLEFGESWEHFTDEEKLIAASACPESLMAELQRQIDNAPKDEPPTEFAW